MDQTNYKHEIDFSTSKNSTLIQRKRKRKRGICNECNKEKLLDDGHVCRNCRGAKAISKPSGNKVIDDFIRYTLIKDGKATGKMVSVSYDQFKDVEFLAEGGFSKVYKAIWIDGPPAFSRWDDEKQSYSRCRNKQNYPVVLKKLNSSKDVTSKELNELKVFYEYYLKYGATYGNGPISQYFGITQDPITQDITIITPYYSSGDLINYFTTNGFYSVSWNTKLECLRNIIYGLSGIHNADIVHRDLHSGNIFFNSRNGNYRYKAVIGDLGISKSATEYTNDNNSENYGIIPYMAPEIFQGQKYTKASDIYSFGMIMWEFMTGRRPFWDEIHDTELIIKICYGLRPSIVTNAPEGYIELMKECWHSNPEKRPTTWNLKQKILNMWGDERRHDKNPTKIIKSSDIGPITENNPGAIYKSRPLSSMIQSAMFTRSLRSQSIISFDKRKFEDNPIENSFNEGKNIKKSKLFEDENNDYVTKEHDFDINTF